MELSPDIILIFCCFNVYINLKSEISLDDVSVFLIQIPNSLNCLTHLSTLQALYQLPYSTYGPESLRLP